MTADTQRKRIWAVRAFCAWLLWTLPSIGSAQTSALYADLNSLEGTDLRPDNVLSYNLQNRSNTAVNVRIKGMVSFKSRPMYLRYELTKLLRPGTNPLTENDRAQLAWTTNEPALKELFLTHGRLPQGTVEYCVDVQPLGNGNEQDMPEAETNCIYHTQEDLFAINLVDPEDKATLYERYPVFSWVANYPFASSLTYRIRVAEQKPGQNPANAIARNNAMWQDNQIAATTAIYPVTGKPLEYGQPYVWTVDAYYKGLLLGGAETWRFILAEDTIKESLPRETPYVDIGLEEINKAYIVGQLKLKYTEDDFLQNEVRITILRNGKAINGKPLIWVTHRGDNFYDHDLTELSLRHKETLEVSMEFLRVKNKPFTKILKFVYVDPALVP